jgi:hypothetical protein
MSESVVLRIGDADLPSRWAIDLQGDQIDLTESVTLFARDAEICIRTGIVSTNPAATVLVAREFEPLSTAEEVHTAGERIVDFLNGILFVQDPARKPISIGGIHERRPNGLWNVAILCASAHITLRGVKALGVVAGQHSPPPVQTAWMAAGLKDEVVADVLTYLRAQPDWFDLYKAYETMTKNTGRNPTGLGWPSERQLSDFRKSAQLRRHSKEWCVRQKLDWPGPIELPEARTLIRSMAKAWLDWKCSTSRG